MDSSGINGQAVYNGTAGVDRIRGGNDNDTFWGGLARTSSRAAPSRRRARRRGSDIITDLGGDDVLKGVVPATTRSTPGPAWTS